MFDLICKTVCGFVVVTILFASVGVGVHLIKGRPALKRAPTTSQERQAINAEIRQQRIEAIKDSGLTPVVVVN